MGQQDSDLSVPVRLSRCGSPNRTQGLCGYRMKRMHFNGQISLALCDAS